MPTAPALPSVGHLFPFRLVSSCCSSFPRAARSTSRGQGHCERRRNSLGNDRERRTSRLHLQLSTTVPSIKGDGLPHPQFLRAICLQKSCTARDRRMVNSASDPRESRVTAEQRRRKNQRRPWHAPTLGIAMSLPGSGVPPPASAGWPNTSGLLSRHYNYTPFGPEEATGSRLPTPSGPAFCSNNHTTQQADRYENPDHPYKHCINTTLGHVLKRTCATGVRSNAEEPILPPPRLAPTLHRKRGKYVNGKTS
jgi:hypothetical protein